MDSIKFKTPTKEQYTVVPRRLFQQNIAWSPTSVINPMGKTLSPPFRFIPEGGDRVIPLRKENDEWRVSYSACNRNVLYDTSDPHPKKSRNGPATPPPLPHSLNISTNSTCSMFPPNGNSENRNDSLVYKCMMRNELLDDCIESENTDASAKLYPIHHQSFFKYGRENWSPNINFSLPKSSNVVTPIFSPSTLRLLKSDKKPQRKIPKNPYKVLDAPELQDDFYLNLVDWSAENMLSVGLNTCVYLWSASNSQVVKLCDLASESDSVTSVHWNEKGNLLAVGTNKGKLDVWDVEAQRKVHELSGHTERIGCLAWNGDIISSASRDKTIICRDVRSPAGSERKLSYHRQEVCGLKWSPDKVHLASGGNDNKLLIWSLRKSEPVQIHSEHTAAVKAIAWSPHHHGVLVSGGGTADKTIRVFNVLTGQPLQAIDTGSQVCNLAFSKHSSELVSTHGYSLNQITIWKYPSLQPVLKLSGHSQRVLFLAMSPNGESIVTGAADETLRFWHVFSSQSSKRFVRSKLNIHSAVR
uniref:WD_REPEATS_REGION domain-containing protein n=1 Tax=Rhabditophanes sp. KR3021 TaxID=114890 RepID=A0AC35TQB8_9BILA